MRPISEMAADDGFSAIKNVPRNAMLTAQGDSQLEQGAEFRWLCNISKAAQIWGAHRTGPAACTHDRHQRMASMDLSRFNPFTLGTTSV